MQMTMDLIGTVHNNYEKQHVIIHAKDVCFENLCTVISCWKLMAAS